MAKQYVTAVLTAVAAFIGCGEFETEKYTTICSAHEVKITAMSERFSRGSDHALTVLEPRCQFPCRHTPGQTTTSAPDWSGDVILVTPPQAVAGSTLLLVLPAPSGGRLTVH